MKQAPGFFEDMSPAEWRWLVGSIVGGALIMAWLFAPDLHGQPLFLLAAALGVAILLALALASLGLLDLAFDRATRRRRYRSTVQEMTPGMEASPPPARRGDHIRVWKDGIPREIPRWNSRNSREDFDPAPIPQQQGRGEPWMEYARHLRDEGRRISEAKAELVRARAAGDRRARGWNNNKYKRLREIYQEVE